MTRLPASVSENASRSPVASAATWPNASEIAFGSEAVDPPASSAADERRTSLHPVKRVPVRSALLVVVVCGALSLGSAGSPAAGRAGCPEALAGATGTGQLAFIKTRRLELLDVATCRVRTLVRRNVESPVRWSADGRYIAFGDGAVVAATGGTTMHPLGSVSGGWAWSTSGDRLVGITAEGGLMVGGPRAARRRLLPNGWGATSVAASPGGAAVAVSRSRSRKAREPAHQEIWMIDLAGGRRHEIFRQPRGVVASPWLFGFAPDGRWLIAWEDSQDSSSLAADGLPLVAVPADGGHPIAVGRGTLVYPDFLSWCGDSLAYVLDHGGREVTLDDRIALAGPPPRWRTAEPAAVARATPLSFTSPACSPVGRSALVASVGPSTLDNPLGHEHRSIWMLDSAGDSWRPFGPPPPAGSSDELPLWSSNGRWIAFIRTTWSATADEGTGRLYLLDAHAPRDGHITQIGPIAEIGTSGNYNGHYNWGDQIAWNSR